MTLIVLRSSPSIGHSADRGAYASTGIVKILDRFTMHRVLHVFIARNKHEFLFDDKKKDSNSLHTRKIADKNCPKNLYLYLCAHIGNEL